MFFFNYPSNHCFFLAFKICNIQDFKKESIAAIIHNEKHYFLFCDLEHAVPQPCTLDGISMNIQEENSARFFQVQSECEQTLIHDMCPTQLGV